MTAAGCGEADPAIHEARVLSYSHSGVPWIFDDDGYQYLIDTGTPRSFVAPPVAAHDDDVFVVETVPGWDVQGMGSDTEVVVTYDLPPAILPMIGSDFGGIMAADVLSRQPFLLDPLRSRFILDDDGNFGEWLSGTEQATRFPVTIAGGGTTCMQETRCFEHEGLRILVDVLVEGEPVVALLDTASTFTTMGRGLFDRLHGPTSRPSAKIARGWDEWEFVRVGDLRMGDVALDDVPVRMNHHLDVPLARLSVETNRKVELLLGHSFMLHFMVGIDYDAPSVMLARYSDPAPVETEMFEGFGIWLFPPRDGSSCIPVVALAHGSDADDAGIDVGDCLLEIDGVDGAAIGDVDLVLRRAPLGQVMEVTVLDTPAPGGRVTAPRSVSLTKRDLLPPT